MSSVQTFRVGVDWYLAKTQSVDMLVFSQDCVCTFAIEKRTVTALYRLLDFVIDKRCCDSDPGSYFVQLLLRHLFCVEYFVKTQWQFDYKDGFITL